MGLKTLVIGASLNEDRYSNMAVKLLTEYKHEVVAFGLKSGNISGVSIDAELKNYNDIDTVTIYLNPIRQKEFYNYIISLKPRRVIFNPGTENIEFQQLLTKEGIQFEEACTLVLLRTNQFNN
ncbi:MAG: CoA-binding protein [Flavobacteriaceae bacterium]|nr:CoA-binding protein [Flavobacteriaceae bacterium]